MIKIGRLSVKKIVIELVLLSTILFTIFVLNKNIKEVLSIFLIIYTASIILFFKKTYMGSINNRKVLVQMIIFACIYVVGYYVIGVFTGFYKNPITVSFRAVIKNIIIYTIIIITTEIIRYRLISKNEKISTTILTISLILLDISLYSSMYDITKLDDFLGLLGLVIFASVSENLLFNYTSTRFGYKPIIIYRFITILYSYIIPILPEVYTYFRAVLRILYPYIIFLFLENVYTPNKIVISNISKTKRAFWAIGIFTIGILLAMLISCRFYFGIMAVGSESMKQEIDKGDAIIFVKYKDQKLRTGDIIVFKKNDINLIHRIINIENINNELRYTTKGDNNNTQDLGYITKKDIIGITKVRLKYIGQPSILLGEFFDTINKREK